MLCSLWNSHLVCKCVSAHFKWTLLSAVKLKNDKNRTPSGILQISFRFFWDCPLRGPRADGKGSAGQDLDLLLRLLIAFDSLGRCIDFSSLDSFCVFTFQSKKKAEQRDLRLKKLPFWGLEFCFCSPGLGLVFLAAFFCSFCFCSSVQFSAKLKSMTFLGPGISWSWNRICTKKSTRIDRIK